MAIYCSCVGCGEVINDLYYLKVGQSSFWHLACLKCHMCSCSLEHQSKCFLFNSKIYCFNDYEKLKSLSKLNNASSGSDDTVGRREDLSSSEIINCQKCRATIGLNDYVMKIAFSQQMREAYFHKSCFTCSDCQLEIAPGQQYGILNDRLLCSMHYNYWQSHEFQQQQQQPFKLNFVQESSDYKVKTDLKELDLNNNTNAFNPNQNNNSSSSSSNEAKKVSVEQTAMKKEEKKKMHHSIKYETSSKHGHHRNSDSSTGSCGTFSSLHSGSSGSKKKRVRTSFKHQQLRTMKIYFQTNPNPDAKDLKELSEKTGLQKRVLQVWFQNSRAKQRKSSTPSNGASSSNATSTSMINYAKSMSMNYSSSPSSLDSKHQLTALGGSSNNKALAQYLDECQQDDPNSNNSNFLSNSNNSLLYADDMEELDESGEETDVTENEDEEADEEEEQENERVNGDESNHQLNDSADDYYNEHKRAAKIGDSKEICKEISSKIQNTEKVARVHSDSFRKTSKHQQQQQPPQQQQQPDFVIESKLIADSSSTTTTTTTYSLNAAYLSNQNNYLQHHFHNHHHHHPSTMMDIGYATAGTSQSMDPFVESSSFIKTETKFHCF